MQGPCEAERGRDDTAALTMWESLVWAVRGGPGLWHHYQVPQGARAQGHGQLCLQGVKERAYASSGEAITSLPVSIPLSTVQPSKLPVSIPLASVVLPSRAEKVVSDQEGHPCRSGGAFPAHGSTFCQVTCWQVLNKP